MYVYMGASYFIYLCNLYNVAHFYGNVHMLLQTSCNIFWVLVKYVGTVKHCCIGCEYRMYTFVQQVKLEF